MKFLSILFREKKYYPFIVCIVALLIAQAWCELELPKYTSDIVDVGIMQGGVEDAVPNEISAASFDKLKLFMTTDERKTADAAYVSGEEGGRLRLVDAYLNNHENRAALAEILQIPELLALQINNMASGVAGAADAGTEKSAQATFKPDAETIALTQKIMMGQGSDADVMALRGRIENQLATIGLGMDMTVTAATEFVRGEYETLGLDMQKIMVDYILHMGLVMLGFSLVAVAASVLVALFASLIASGVCRKIRRDAFTQIMRYSNVEMDKFSPASLITRCTNDIQQIQMSLVMFLRLVLFAPVMAVSGIVMVTRTDTGLSWIIVAAVVVLAAIIGVLLGLTMPKFQRMQGYIDDVNLVSREILTGLSVIRAFNREDYETKRFDKVNTVLYKNQLFTNRAMSMFLPIVFFVINMIMVGIIWFGGKGIDAGEMQIGGLIAFMSYAMFIVMSFMMLSMVMIMLPRANVAAGRVLEVIHTDSTIVDKPEAERKDEEREFSGRVVFDDVCFRYHDADEDTLSGVSFTAEPGKTTAVIGGTGSGKSTLINLIPRLFDVTRGRVMIDDVDVRDLSQEKLRSLIGVVPQKGVLFAGTIASNIKYSGEDVTDADMEKAAEIAQAAGFIAEKDGVYESEIAQGGGNVSGGQRQRLAIARAVAKHPKIFIFDDSFSALDYKTDANLRRALAKNLGDATILIVAQRIATILRADKIIVLDEGEIVGEGTHRELMESCEVYRDIASSQLNEKELSA